LFLGARNGVLFACFVVLAFHFLSATELILCLFPFFLSFCFLSAFFFATFSCFHGIIRDHAYKDDTFALLCFWLVVGVGEASVGLAI
jgi:hypothetical protein